MSLSSQLREQIDACRPGKGDLALPALADLAAALPHDASLRDELARSQKFDGAVTAALSDLPVPEGLADRLLAALAERGAPADENRAESNQTSDSAAAVVEVAPRPMSGIWNRRLSRRAWSYAAASAATLLVAGSLGMWLWTRSPRVVTAEELTAELETLIRTARASSPRMTLPRGYSLPTALGVRPVSYQPFTAPAGRSAVAVNLPSPATQAATLFIIRARSRLPATPRPLSASAGRTAVAWQAGDFVYVLVLDRGLSLDDYLTPPRQA